MDSIRDSMVTRPALAWTPAARPARAVLAGRFARLEPLDARRHGPALSAAARQPGAGTLWDYMGYGPFPDPASHIALLHAQSGATDPLFFAVIDTRTGDAAGVTAYLRIAPEHGVIEIGHIWFAPSLQRRSAATECLFLMMQPVFDRWGYRRLEWKCDAGNAASRRAAARLGFRYEGTFRQHMVVKDRNRDTAWFSMLDADWPAVRAGFDAWLAPDNFDAHGRQRQRLRAGGDGAG